MGACESGNNSRETNISSNPLQPKPPIKDETIINGQPPIPIDPCVANPLKALCFIKTQGTLGSGFLIRLFKGTQNFFCLITCEHVIKKEMVNQRQTIKFFYDSLNRKLKQIVLNPDERLIQDFRNPDPNEKEYDIDAIVIEILPKDNISKEYFLEPDIESIYKFDKLEKEKIAIIQYPKGILSYAYGEIKKIYKTRNYFAHKASTKEGSAGSPIFLKDSIQVIGIHKGGVSDENYGEFIGPIFNYFQNFTVKKEPWNKYIMYKNEIKDNTNIIKNNKKEGNININIPNNIPINQLNQMTIIYNIVENKNSIKIFGYDFVENNKNKCYLIINGKQRELCVYLNMNEIKIENNQLKIKIKENKHITNMSCMFSDCSSLVSLPDISKWNTANVTDMNYMFCNCSSLVSFPDISKWNTANATNMSYMFYSCYSLKSLPDLSKWNTSNVTNMSHMFYGCSSLVSLPDLSKWNTANVTNMNSMFSDCRSLKSFPDISKWKLNKELDKRCVFDRCNISIIPEIFK